MKCPNFTAFIAHPFFSASDVPSAQGNVSGAGSLKWSRVVQARAGQHSRCGGASIVDRCHLRLSHRLNLDSAQNDIAKKQGEDGQKLWFDFNLLPSFDIFDVLPVDLHHVFNGSKAPVPDLVQLAHMLGGQSVAMVENRGGVVQFTKTVIHPKTRVQSTRFYAIYQPGALLDSELRGFKATLKIGNPRTYGLPRSNEDKKNTIQMPWFQFLPYSTEESKKSLTQILRNNYVITIKNAVNSKFGAVAVLHADPDLHQKKDSVQKIAYIGQVVNGPRDPAAGEAKPMSVAERSYIVQGGGKEAVVLAIRLAAYLGHDAARLYTNRPSLGERAYQQQRSGHDSKKTFYDSIGEDLGLDIAYTVAEANLAHRDGDPLAGSLSAKPILRPKPSLDDTLSSEVAGQMQLIPQKTLHYHYTYLGLEQLRDSCGGKSE